MDSLKITTSLSDLLTRGLDTGALQRIGGVIQEVASGKIVAFVREHLKETATELVGFLGTGTGIGVLNLAVATMGFPMVLKRVNGIERRLQRTNELLHQINQKLDLGFFANFAAALSLAENAFAMRNPENRKAHAMEAINRLFEAEHYYTRLLDAQLNADAHAADAYLDTLCLAHVAVTRCYLELEELETAARLITSARPMLQKRIRQHVNTLLTSNPAAYLHPSLKGKVDLRRLSKVYRWLDPKLDENRVFEDLREKLFSLIREPELWIKSLPAAIWDADRSDRDVLQCGHEANKVVYVS